MSTDRPDWFGTGEPPREPDLGSETDRAWFEDLGFERTTPGTVDGDRSSAAAWAVAGATDQQDRPVDGVGDEPTVDEPTAGTGARAEPGLETDADPTASDGPRSDAGQPSSGRSDSDADATAGENGGFLSWLKSLFGF